MRIYPDDTVDDEFRKLGELGHTGALNDRQKGALEAIGFTGAIADGFGKYRADGNFNPYVLNGEMFLDPSDISTMFQDTAGTTPVTSPGDPVGLMLDKSRGLALGPEIEPVKEAGGAGASWDAETKTLTFAEGVFSQFRFTAEVGSVFRVRGTLVSIGNGATSVSLRENETGFPAVYGGGVGEIDEYIQTISDDSLKLYQASYDGAVIENLRVQEVFGNHVTAPSDAARPTYQADGFLSDDGVDDALIAPLTGTYSAYIAAGGSLVQDESVAMSNDYDVLRDDMVGVVIVEGTLTDTQKAQVAAHFGVTL